MSTRLHARNSWNCMYFTILLTVKVISLSPGQQKTIMKSQRNIYYKYFNERQEFNKILSFIGEIS